MYRMVTTAPYRHRPQIEASKGSAHHPPNRPLRQPRHSTTAPPNAHRPPAATHSPTPTPTDLTAPTTSRAKTRRTTPRTDLSGSPGIQRPHRRTHTDHRQQPTHQHRHQPTTQPRHHHTNTTPTTRRTTARRNAGGAIHRDGRVAYDQHGPADAGRR